jgi:hypothetical protein
VLRPIGGTDPLKAYVSQRLYWDAGKQIDGPDG